MGAGQQGRTPLTDVEQQRRFYRKWRYTLGAQAVKAPAEYHFLTAYPKNFRAVRDAFQLAYITHKMTGG